MTTIIAQLLLQEPSKLKIWSAEVIMRTLGFYVTLYGISFFKDLSHSTITYTLQALGIDANASWAQNLGTTIGRGNLLGYCLLWGTLMSNAIHRPGMRLFGAKKIVPPKLKVSSNSYQILLHGLKPLIIPSPISSAVYFL